jgi:hypothetical protein
MTRMWMVDETRMCRQHLLGEHKELHQLVGLVLAGRVGVLLGHARLGQIDTGLIRERHEALAAEMLRRGYRHLSPLRPFSCERMGSVDAAKNLLDLTGRCPRCAENFNNPNQEIKP